MDFSTHGPATRLRGDALLLLGGPAKSRCGGAGLGRRHNGSSRSGSLRAQSKYPKWPIHQHLVGGSALASPRTDPDPTTHPKKGQVLLPCGPGTEPTPSPAGRRSKAETVVSLPLATLCLLMAGIGGWGQPGKSTRCLLSPAL